MAQASSAALPEGVRSILDTDLYKLTMQCVIHKFFPDVHVTYNFTNRTPHMKINRIAHRWLQAQIDKLANVTLSKDEFDFLKTNCPYLNTSYLNYLSTFRLKPSEHITVNWNATEDTGQDQDHGEVTIKIAGLWLETILYEIPLLALVSEAYFKFCDTDWSYDGQLEIAKTKGTFLLKEGCIFSEFGSRRRRDYHTQDLVIQGLLQAREGAAGQEWKGKLQGTSNVHFAMRYGLQPVGTVAHEWFMGVAAITDSYENSSELALRYWVATFGEGVLAIALTDTYGTPTFLKAFKQPIPTFATALPGSSASVPSASGLAAGTTVEAKATTTPPVEAPVSDANRPSHSYAEVFTGVRQDSGDPLDFIKVMRQFYDEQGITEKKVMVFSDSLNLELCAKYKVAAEAQGFQPTFGVGTFLTNDFKSNSTGEKSVPLNIVIKLASASGRAAVKISDNIGKNTGDAATVAEVKRRLGYEEKSWVGGDETKRWGGGGN